MNENIEKALKQFLLKPTEETEGELLFTVEDIKNAFSEGYKASENKKQ